MVELRAAVVKDEIILRLGKLRQRFNESRVIELAGFVWIVHELNRLAYDLL